MNHFEQYEVWQMNDDKWEFLSSFPEFEVAYTVAKNRKAKVRLLKVTYEDGTSCAQEIIAELGETRSQP